MTDRALVIDEATGSIRRTIHAAPAMLALQVGVGEALFVVVDDDGLCIHDGNLAVSEGGELIASESAPEGFEVPTYTIEYVAV